ncbi:MAG: HNH endonuclease, partial [Desulfovibrio sp.]|nr:HNH endonuclease [Desulfovibrio sp.]
QYVLDRDGYTCQECGKKNVQLEVHHIKPRREQGADIPDNLVTLCRECHRKADNGLVCLNNRNGDRSKTRHATQTDIINGRICEYLTENGIPFTKTSGGDTKAIRQHFGLPKSHVNDAVCISLFYLYDNGADVDDVSIPDGYLMEVCHAKGTYQRSQGQALKKSRYINGYSHPAQQHHARILANRSKCKFGFRVNDKVTYNGRTWFLCGVRSAGNCVLKDIHGNRLKTESGKSSKTVNLKGLVRVSAATSRMREWVKT